MKIQQILTFSIICLLFVCKGFSQSKESTGQHLFPDNEKLQFMLNYLATGAYGTGKINKIRSYFKKNISSYSSFYIYDYDDFGRRRKNLGSVDGRDEDNIHTYHFEIAKGKLLVSSKEDYVFNADKVTQKENLLIGYGKFSGTFIYTYNEVNYLIINSPCVMGGYCTEIKSNGSSDDYVKENKPEFLREIAANELSDEKITLAKKIKTTVKTFPHNISSYKQFSKAKKVGEYYLMDNILYKGGLKNEKPDGSGYISFLSEEMTIEEIGKKIAYLEATTVYFNNGEMRSISGKEVELALSDKIEEVHCSEGGIVSLYLKSRPEKIIIKNDYLNVGKRNDIMFSSNKNYWSATATLTEKFEIINPTIAMYIRQVDCHLKVGEYYTMGGTLDGKNNIIEDKNKRVLLQGRKIKYYSDANSYSIGDWDITNNDNVCQNGTHITYHKDGEMAKTEYSYNSSGVCIEHSSKRSNSDYKYRPPILFSDEAIQKGNAIFGSSGSSSKGVATRCPLCNGAGRHYEYEIVEDCDVIFEETDAGVWRKENCKDVQRVKNIQKCDRCKGKGMVTK